MPNSSASLGGRPCRSWNRTPAKMPKLKLLIFDANVVIFLFENGLWQQVLARCEIHLSRIVAEDEVRYYHGREADEVIDLTDDVTHGRIHLFDLAPSDLKRFVDQFDLL